VRGYARPERVEIVFRAGGHRGSARLLPLAKRAEDAEDVALFSNWGTGLVRRASRRRDGTEKPGKAGALISVSSTPE